jgi:hypothetical protein
MRLAFFLAYRLPHPRNDLEFEVVGFSGQRELAAAAFAVLRARYSSAAVDRFGQPFTG